MGVRAGRRHDGPEDVVLALVRGHAAELLRFARRFSLCSDDAQDAYQRALEILMRRLREAPVDNPLSYLRTIIRHEAYQVRVERERDVPRHEVDAEAAGTERDEDPSERAERFERLTHTAEALQRLKPQELKALTLRAEGLSYREICEREGWTYTRCNRSVTEGRRALLERLGAIESGAECARWLPLLSVFADGEADARAVAELRPHLRGCTACRATLRELHDSARGIRAVVPPELLLPAIVASGSSGGIAAHVEALMHGAFERIAAPALRLHGAVEALPGAKVAAVAASTVAVAGGGAAIEHAATKPASSRPPARVEHVAAAGSSVPPSASGQPTTASVSRPATLLRVTSLPAGPEWPAGAADRGSAQQPLDEFGFERPVSRSAAGGPGADAADAPPAGPTNAPDAGSAHGVVAGDVPRQSAAAAGSDVRAPATGRPAGEGPSDPHPSAGEDSGSESEAAATPLSHSTPPTSRADPEFPASEFYPRQRGQR